MPIRARDVPQVRIELAKQFLRQPLTELFHAWRTLKDTDRVEMSLHELAHLLAWYEMATREKAKLQPTRTMVEHAPVHSAQELLASVQNGLVPPTEASAAAAAGLEKMKQRRLSKGSE